MSEEEILQKYTPQFKGSKYQKEMSLENIQKDADKMTADDVAWQVLNGNNDIVKYIDGKLADKHFGMAQMAFLQLLSKSTPKEEKNNIARWLLEKEGVSFVAGASMKTFIKTLAKKKIIDPSIVKKAQEEENTDNIFYNKIKDPVELRKFDINEYGYQLAKNLYTPEDMLVKIMENNYKSKKKEYKNMVLGFSYSSASNKEITNFRVDETLTHPNMSINKKT